jgi:PQQ-like domain
VDLRELNTILAGLGRAPVRLGFVPQREETLAADPWRLVTHLDRGEREVLPFPDEDAACRWLLTRELIENPPPARDGSAPVLPDLEPDPRVSGAAPGGLRRDRNQPPVVRWRRPLRPFSKLSGRGSGVAVVTDSSSLYRHGVGGCLHLVALDVATGRQLWTVPVWPSSHWPTVHVLGDTVLVRTDSWWAGFDSRTGECRWRGSPASTARVVAQHAGLAVLALGEESGMAGLDLRTGALVWRYPGQSSHPGYAYDGIPVLSRTLCVSADRGRIAVDAVRVADGSCRGVLDVAEPRGYRKAHLTLIADMLDEDGQSGYVQVRGRAQRRPREVGTRLGDLLLVAGRGDAVMVHNRPVTSMDRGHLWAVAADAEHYLLTPSYLDDAVRFVDIAGRTLWEQPGRYWHLHRMPALTLIAGQRDNAADPDVVAIDDHGAVRWRVAGSLGFVHDGVAWVRHGTRSAGYDAATGDQLWQRAGVEPAQLPNRIRGFHPDDGHLLSDADDELVAVG